MTLSPLFIDILSGIVLKYETNAMSSRIRAKKSMRGRVELAKPIYVLLNAIRLWAMVIPCIEINCLF